MGTPSASERPAPRNPWIRRGLMALGVTAVLGLLFWLLLPTLSQSVLTGQLESLEDRTGVAITAGNISTLGRHGIAIQDLDVPYPDSETPLLTIESIEAEIDLWRAARGQPTLTGIQLSGLTLHITRYDDGSTTFDRLRRADADDDEPGLDDLDDPFTDGDDGLEALLGHHLRHFGDQFPEVNARDMRVLFTSQIEDQPWPIEALSVEHASMTPGDDVADFELPLAVQGNDAESTGLPDAVSVSGQARRPLDESLISIDFEPWLRPTQFVELPHLQAEVGGLAISEPFTIEIDSPALQSTLRSTPEIIAEAHQITFEVSRWRGDPRDLSILEFHIDAPRLPVAYGTSGASNLSELHTLLRQPTAQHVVHQADQTASAIDTLRNPPEEENPSQDPTSSDDEGSLLGDLSVEELLAEVLPRRTRITDLQIDVEDLREHPDLTAPTHTFQITGDLLELKHSPLQGLLEADVSLQTITDDHRGHALIDIAFPYRSGDWEASIDIDALELSQFAQLLGPGVSRHLQGGRVSALLDMQTHSDDGYTSAEGLFSLQDARFYFDLIAPDPIVIDSAGLQFDGHYAPATPLPEPQWLNPERMDPTKPDEEDDPEAYAAYRLPPQSGAIVLDNATARLHDLEATLSAGLFGLDGTSRPNRFQLDIDLPTTSVQTIVDAVPSALRGPLDGLRVDGDLTWAFSLEVPLHRASQMAWNTDVDLSDDLEILSLPDAVDVFKLMDSFQHTLSDDWEADFHHREREFLYQREITIPEASPTPVQWILDNTELDLDDIDEQRREREWPELPHWTPELGISQTDYRDAQIWLEGLFDDHYSSRPWDDFPEAPERDIDSMLTRWAMGQADDIDDEDEDALIFEAPDPPEFYETEITIDADRHGPYVYVPLHHISPYVVRAILTTEDNSFFSHNGFNFFAIRHSVEDNIEAGRYVRGASTISMQLAKNLFLDFDRHLSRKLQEVTLVWLMESMADIPKTRLMELYLNIIEFGPGVFGINEAALYYFGKRPDMLTVAEAAWLVSIVPNPKRFHRYYDRGEINPFWQQRMARYIRAMYHRERITEEEKEIALDQVPEFYYPDDGEPLILPYDEDQIVEPQAPVHQREEDEEPDLDEPPP